MLDLNAFKRKNQALLALKSMQQTQLVSERPNLNTLYEIENRVTIELHRPLEPWNILHTDLFQINKCIFATHVYGEVMARWRMETTLGSGSCHDWRGNIGTGPGSGSEAAPDPGTRRASAVSRPPPPHYCLPRCCCWSGPSSISIVSAVSMSTLQFCKLSRHSRR